MGRLEICVCAARNVGNIQKIGKVDPYVKVKMQDHRNVKVKYRTQVVENSLDPVWNELFKFQIADSNTTQILFELWNDNIAVDDLLGSYRLSLNGLKQGVVQDMWVILTGTKLTTAELHLRVLAVDFGRDPDSGDTVVSSLEENRPAVPAKLTTRPNRNANESMSTYPINLRPPPQIVVNQPQYKPPTVPSAPTGQTQPAYYGAPQPPYQAPAQPMYYGAPQPPYQAPAQPMYMPGPQQFTGPAPTVQHAYGVPPNM